MLQLWHNYVLKKRQETNGFDFAHSTYWLVFEHACLRCDVPHISKASGLIGRVCCYLNCMSEPSWTDTVENIQSYLTRQCYLTLLPASTSLKRTCSVLSFSSITCTVALWLHVGILSEIFVSKRLCCEIVPLVEKKHGDRSTAAS